MKRWTIKEENNLKDLRQDGYNYKQIAVRVRISRLNNIGKPYFKRPTAGIPASSPPRSESDLAICQRVLSELGLKLSIVRK